MPKSHFKKIEELSLEEFSVSSMYQGIIVLKNI
jgi:hypothetical protein